MVLLFLFKMEVIEMAKATIAGLSSLGITFGWGVETEAGVKPELFYTLDRINSIGDITIENEVIDASALEDVVERSVQGRGATGGTFAVSVNYTPETVKQWQQVIDSYNTAKESGLRVWFQTIIPGFTESDFVVAQPPTFIPSPSKGQNELLVVDMNLTIEEYVGFDAKVALTENAA